MREYITDQIATARLQVKSSLIAPDGLSDDQCRVVIRRYSAAIIPNFVVWMAGASVACRSLEGRFAAAENLYLEIKDHHPGMLRSFAETCGAEPGLSDYHYAENMISTFRSEVSQMSGLFLLSFMTILESTSPEFIPWLAKLAVKLGSNNLMYTDMHGEADVEHAEQFAWALEHEARMYDEAKVMVAHAFSSGTAFLKGLLTPD